jgi:uncharacterized Tic20 family protein
MTSSAFPQPTSDERTLAALAHFFGIIGALIVWVLQKDKSPFVRFQSLQSLVFEALIIALNMVLMMCLFGAMFFGVFGAFIASINHLHSQGDVGPWMMLPVAFPFLMFSCFLPISLVIFIARIVATVSVASGQDFRYPWIGRWLEKALDK